GARARRAVADEREREDGTGRSVEDESTVRSYSVFVDNPVDGTNTSVRVVGPNRRGSLARTVSALTNYGLDVVSSFTRTTDDGRTVDDVFYVTMTTRSLDASFDDAAADAGQVPESSFQDLERFIVQALTVTGMGERYTSRMPKIYGVAAETEILAMQHRLGEIIGDGSQAIGESESMALQLELVAAELASATARLVQIDRVYSKVESCGIDALWELDGSDEVTLSEECIRLEAERADASAMFGRKLAAMEAALASRERARAKIVRKNQNDESSMKRAQGDAVSTLAKSRLPLDERNTVAAPKLKKITEMAPQTPFASPLSRPLPSTPCGNGRELILQGFNWESCQHAEKMGASWYAHLTEMTPQIAEAGFTSVWLPPPTKSVSKQGYLPTDLYNLNSFYGSEDELRSCVARLREYNITPVADIVINHRCAEAKDDAGRWNKYTGKLDWDERAITCENPAFGGRGAHKTGEDYLPAPNIDHTQEFVRRDLTQWLEWLRSDVGFRGWRFDFVKGYSGAFTGEYVEATRPFLAFGEFWDECGYRDGVLDYNQDAHRQRTCNWVDSTTGNTAAFDFTTKGILQEAVSRTEYWRLIDNKGRPPGFLGIWPSRAVTFIENHDTGSTLQHWPFPWDKVLQGYCYILTHPGTPTVFFDHWVDPVFKPSIDAMLEVRKRNRLSSKDAAIHIERATAGVYAAHVGHAKEAYTEGLCTDVDVTQPSICMKIGHEAWSPNAQKVGNLSWQCTASGDGWAVWEDKAHLVDAEKMTR
ncbi:Glycosyl hydrolase, family 13, catalytic domain, partial [Ostreococcus tauri]